MFCDTALSQPYGNKPEYLIEYSFAHAYHWVFNAGEESGSRVQYPSIHFRHRGKANVVWCDGHLTSEEMATEAEKHFTRIDLGWFGPDDNSLFDPY
jgi:prepilin-type processing-associated H-X9-DG protein